MDSAAPLCWCCVAKCGRKSHYNPDHTSVNKDELDKSQQDTEHHTTDHHDKDVNERSAVVDDDQDLDPNQDVFSGEDLSFPHTNLLNKKYGFNIDPAKNRHPQAKHASPRLPSGWRSTKTSGLTHINLNERPIRNIHCCRN